jgi:hypothetical protein
VYECIKITEELTLLKVRLESQMAKAGLFKGDRGEGLDSKSSELKPKQDKLLWK